MLAVKKGILAAAGSATRMWPSSKVFPKELFPLGRFPAIAYVIWEMIEAGISDITIVVRKNNINVIESLLDANAPPPASVKNEPIVRRFEEMIRACTFSFVEQSGPYGNGTPLLDGLRGIIDEPCIYAFADDVVFGENASAGLVRMFLRTNHVVLASQVVGAEDTRKFGILECAPNEPVQYVKRFVEKPSHYDTASRLASFGRYLITPDVIHTLRTLQPGQNGEIWLSDAFIQLLRKSIPVVTFQLTSGRWYTVGDMDGFAEAVRAAHSFELVASSDGLARAACT
jgi:UTP--glucose-1-phosphate uridylyltransferase